jgi:hypothetical protein
MTTALLITTHQRGHITQICFDGVDRIRETFAAVGIEIVPYIAVSDERNRSLCELYGYDYIDVPNTLVGKKHNELLAHALFDDWEYMMQLGSDDLLLDTAALRLAAEMFDGQPAFGFNHIAFTDEKFSKLKTLKTIMVFEAGRCLRRDIVEESIAKHGSLWLDHRNRGLDGQSQSRLSCSVVPIPTRRPQIVDIKSDVNINSWESVGGIEMKYTKLTPEMR